MSDTKQVPATATSTIKLPSRGVLYGGLIPDGAVEVRKLTVQEISILESQGSGGIERLNTVLRSCCRLPNPGIHHGQLLITDRMAILLALRTFTYGPLYNFQYKCMFCGSVCKSTVNIAEDLEEHEADDELKEPITVELKDSNSVVMLRFLRGDDEDKVAKYAKRVKMQSNDQGDPSSMHRIALQIVALNGDEKVELRRREDFVRGLTAADLIRLNKAVDEKEPGLDLTVFPDCSSCGSTNELNMPFTGEFFRPTNV